MKQKIEEYYKSGKPLKMMYRNKVGTEAKKENLIVTEVTDNGFKAKYNGTKSFPYVFSGILDIFAEVLVDVNTITLAQTSNIETKSDEILTGDKVYDMSKYFYEGLIYGDSLKNKDILKEILDSRSSNGDEKILYCSEDIISDAEQVSREIITKYGNSFGEKNTLSLNWFPIVYRKITQNQYEKRIPEKVFPLYINVNFTRVVQKDTDGSKNGFFYYLSFAVNPRINELIIHIPKDLIIPFEDTLPVFDEEEVRNLLNHNPFAVIDNGDFKANYEKVLTYVEGITEKMVATNISDVEYGRDNQFLFMEQSVIFTKQIRSHYEKLLDNRDKIYNNLSLYKNFISAAAPRRDANEDIDVIDIQHVGQLKNKFALLSTQREAVKHALNLEQEGTILAVNGPPGTGKTTILQSIIISGWVKAAIEGKDAPVVLATAATNRAITNIIDAFIIDGDSENKLENRWLPKVNTLGLYFTGDDKIKKYLKIGDIRNINNFYGENDIKENKKIIFSNIREIIGVSCNSLEDAKIIFRDFMIDGQQKIQQANNILIEISRNNKELDEQRNILESMPTAESINLKIEELKSTKIDLCSLFDLLEQSFAWYYKIPFLEPFLRERKKDRVELHLVQQEIAIPVEPFLSIRAFTKYIKKIDDQVKELEKINEDRIEQKERVGKLIKQLDINTLELSELVKVTINRNDSLETMFKKTNTYLDLNIRYNNFLYAIHYWECEFLLKIERLKKDVIEDNSRETRILSCLTPLFISTCHSGPRYFGNGNIIDTLIIDEAGQLSVEIGAPMFSLAKKAIIVGDTLQIQPIWSLSPRVDQMMIHQYLDSINPEQTMESIKPWLVSGGSVMDIGCMQSQVHRKGKQTGGLLLQEHFRCFDEIIDYCNDVVYGGELRPLKKSIFLNEEGKKVLQVLSYIFEQKILDNPMIVCSIESQQSYQGKSLINRIEAEKIIDYVEQIYKAFPDVEIEKLVSIITPFSAQSIYLQKMARKRNTAFGKITIGTIHTMQGAENEIIFFSPVYDETNEKKVFYNETPNMLNVAVSRAKTAFITVGSVKMLQKEKNSYSDFLVRKSAVVVVE